MIKRIHLPWEILFKKLEIADRIQEIKCPVLVICGEKDRANKKSAYYFSENIENVALCMIEKTGHVVNEENPKELARILNEYYDGKWKRRVYLQSGMISL